MAQKAKNPIKAAREKSGLKARELASMMGISLNLMWAWESDKNPRKPGFDKAQRLVGILGAHGLTMKALGFYIGGE